MIGRKKSRVLILGEKETFLIRVLIKKMADAKLDAEFVKWKVTDIENAWKDTDMITLYMDEGEHPGSDVVHFLTDKMKDADIQMIPVGEKKDVKFIVDNMPGDLIFKTFNRPMDNDVFIVSVLELLNKVAEGEFKKSVLIVDDDPNYMGLVREWLKGSYKVSMANSGLQAIKWLGKNKADLILLDYEMPVTTGPQVLEMLRHDEETRDIPVMFLTGKNDKKSVVEVMALKPQGYFLKTIERAELMKILNEFFALKK
ncbi:MAG: response regulator [Lachnospiraceae bacterium]|nr:response regulator [Lachnospiraceae bacterium]